jgi:hypothetical protein
MATGVAGRASWGVMGRFTETIGALALIVAACSESASPAPSPTTGTTDWTSGALVQWGTARIVNSGGAWEGRSTGATRPTAGRPSRPARQGRGIPACSSRSMMAALTMREPGRV